MILDIKRRIMMVLFKLEGKKKKKRNVGSEESFRVRLLKLNSPI